MSVTKKSFDIRVKLVTAFALVLCGTIGLGLFALNRLDRVSATAANLRDNWLPAEFTLGDVARYAEQIRIKQIFLMEVSSSEERNEITAESAKINKLFDESLNSYLSTIDLDAPDLIEEERVLSRTMTEAWKAYTNLSSKNTEIINHGTHEQAVSFSSHDVEAAMQAFRSAWQADMAFQVREGKKSGDNGAALAISARFSILVVLAAMAALCIVVGWSLVRGISAPISKMTAAMQRLANRDMATEIPGVGRSDEIGGMAAAVQVFKDSMVRAEHLTREQEQSKVAAAEAQKAAMSKTANEFETKIGGLISMLSAGATELQATAEAMSSTAGTTNQQATMVAGAAEEASAGVQTVAAAAEQLTASIREISGQMAHSSTITNRAVVDAQRTNVIVQALSEGAEKIGHVVGLITDIAGQTNLLALNATIEAARAGEAGKGFAVVASEVKSLAQQTAKATQEIGSQIAQIQAATKEAVDAIHAIVVTISEVSSIASSIAAAVQEQGAATGEIARNVQQTAQAAQNVTMNIGGVSQAANDTGAAASQVLGAANGLSQQSEQLAVEVKSFVAQVRAS